MIVLNFWNLYIFDGVEENIFHAFVCLFYAGIYL